MDTVLHDSLYDMSIQRTDLTPKAFGRIEFKVLNFLAEQGEEQKYERIAADGEFPGWHTQVNYRLLNGTNVEYSSYREGDDVAINIRLRSKDPRRLEAHMSLAKILVDDHE